MHHGRQHGQGWDTSSRADMRQGSPGAAHGRRVPRRRAQTLKSKQIQAAMLGLAAGAAGGRRRRRTGSSGSGPRGVLGVPSSSSRDTILLGGAAAEGESGSDESREGRGPCSPGSKAVAACMVSSTYWAAHEGRRTTRPAYRDVGAAQGRRERVRPLLEMEQTMQGELEPHLPAVAFIAKAPMPGRRMRAAARSAPPADSRAVLQTLWSHRWADGDVWATGM